MLNKYYKQKFRERLKEERLLKNLSIKECSQKINVSVSIWLKWERGEALPMGTNASKLSRLFNVKVDYLFGLKDEKS